MQDRSKLTQILEIYEGPCLNNFTRTWDQSLEAYLHWWWNPTPLTFAILKYTASLSSYAHTALWHLNHVEVPSQQGTRIKHCNIERIDPQELLLPLTTSELPFLGQQRMPESWDKPISHQCFPFACFIRLQLLLSFWGPSCTCSSLNFQPY